MKVCGVGINDCPGWATDKKSYKGRVYTLWQNMLKRCYDSNYHKAFPSYAGCSVHEEWHTLSIFAEGIKQISGYDRFEANEYRITLDKDGLVPGNRQYGPGLVRFISCQESTREVDLRHWAQGTGVANRGAIDSKSRKIIIVWPDGTEEKILQNEACRKYGMDTSCITRVMRGERKEHKGCKFREDL